MADLAAQLAAVLGPFPGQSCVVAFSGGLDSTVLLHLVRHAETNPVRAVHVDHGLHPSSADWADRAVATASAMGVECEIVRVEVVDDGQGREAAARAARYAALRERIDEGELLLTAHHADDQAETVLLALLRGSGPAGLAAMPLVAPFGHGMLVRPLLRTRRAALQAWGDAHQLEWTDDPSNTDTSIARNHLRRNVLPVLEAYWPETVGALNLGARWAAEADGLLGQLAELDLAALTDGKTLDAEGVIALGPDRARNLLRVWLAQLGLPGAPYTRLDEAVRQLAEAAEDRVPEIDWPGAVLRRWAGRLYAMKPEQPVPDDWHAEWLVEKPLPLPAGLGQLSLVSAPTGLDPAKLMGSTVKVRFRHGGERLRTHPTGPHRQLKHLLAEAGVPPWDRGRVPLLFMGDILVAAGDLFVDAAWAASPGLLPTVTT